MTAVLRYILIMCVAAFVATSAFGQARDAYFVSGMVRDSISGEPLPYASVTLLDKSGGTLTDDRGLFELTVPRTARRLQVACLGYEKKTVDLRYGQVNLYDVQLAPSATELHEVVVHRQKYSKKNNPAVDFAVKLRSLGPRTDPRRNDNYNYARHELSTVAINDFAHKDENSWMFRQFPELWNHVDTSEISGKPILNIIVKEKASDVHFRRDPKGEKEIVTGLRREGFDEIADRSSLQTFTEDILREIDLYQNDINLLQNRFVSPLSKIAPDFYKFYLTDTVEVDSQRCVVLSFYPHNPAVFGFNGQVFVPVGDEDMFIKKVTMRKPRNQNLNFIDNLYISQEFDRAPDGSRLKVRDDLTIEATLIPGTPGIYARRNIAYTGHNFDAAPDSVFSGLGGEVYEKGATVRDDSFWDQVRVIAVTDNEKTVGNMLEQLRERPVFYWGEKVLKVMVNGYITTGRESKFDIGPMNTTVSRNTLEGWRLRAGGMTTANLSKRWFGRGYAAYGTRDHRWKYSGEVEYSFIDKEYHSREFPVHSLRFTHLYDVDHIGQHYLFTNSDNMFLSWKRLPDEQVTYHRVSRLEYTLELRNNFSVNAAVKHERQEGSRLLKFRLGDGTPVGHYDETSFSITLRYAPGEKFYQMKTGRVPINLDAPVVQLTHTVAPRGFLGSRFTVNRTELNMQKRFWFSAFGYADVVVGGGHVWSQVPFPNLLIPNANLSYTIQPESFATMNAMEFITDSYCSWDVTYWANGAILNYIPFVKKLKLREVFAFRGFYGRLSDRNNPALHPDKLFAFPANVHTGRMHTPYMEASVGLDNIFRCIRLDYVWRLNYLHPGYPIDRHGLRFAFHVTF